MYQTLTLTLVVVLTGTALGQSRKPEASNEIFHVAGTIDNPVGAVMPHVEVRFGGDAVNRTVATDDKGNYKADLPVGTYVMTAAFPPSGPNHTLFTKYDRFFRVQSPTSIMINGGLYMIYSCFWGGRDTGVADATSPEPSLTVLDESECGGEDSFTFPSRDGTPLRLEIQYVWRERGEKMLSYTGSSVVHRPVLVAYNLFGLQADSVDYNSTDGTIRAYGNVVFEDESGQNRAKSAGFKFNDGKAIRVW